MKGLSFYCTLILASFLICSIPSFAGEKTGSSTTNFVSETNISSLASPLNDSLALVAIYNSTNGFFWSIGWNLSAPMSSWNGVTLNASGCVIELFLDGNNLSGTLPPEIGNLSQLRIMHLDNNNMGGTLPPEIGNLAQLRIAFLDDNNFTGSIPANWGNLNNLITLFLDNNMLSGAVPIEFAGLDNLQNFDFFNNQIDSLPDLSSINTLQPNKFRVFNNNLSFDDILPNLGPPLANNYAPQDSIYTKTDVTLNAGSNYSIDLGIDEGISSNIYQWYKDGTLYFTGNSHKLNFPSIGFADSGTYWCIVTNPNAPNLTLYSRCATINVVCGIVLGTYMPTLCDGESVEIGGITYNASNPVGNEFLPGGSQHGCDSLTNIQLSFYDPIEFDFNALLCIGDTIIVNGESYHQGNPNGTEIIEDGSFAGCDSTVNVNLSFITPVSSGSVSQVLCPGESIDINGVDYNQTNPSGTEILPNAAYNGCDSIVDINLSFHDPAISYLHQTLCTGEEIVVNGTVYNAANPTGVEILSNQSYLSCDSIVDIDLSFDDAIQEAINNTLCIGESIMVNGNTYDQVNPTGTETMLNASYLGCDSIVTVNLSFYTSPTTQLNPEVCTGESIVINGTTYNQTNPIGDQTLANQAYLGCDSLIHIELIFLDIPENHITTTLCNGESIIVNGTTYDQTNANGMQSLDNQAFNGCDSLIYIDLDFYAIAENFIDTTLCADETLTIAGVVYDQSNPSGTEILSNQSFRSCDSIIHINLNFHPIATSDLNLMLCEGESILVNGNLYDQSNPTGTEILPNQSFQACDSIVNINLNFYPPAIHEINSTLCLDETMTINGTVYNQSNPNGTETLTGASYHNCDSTININLQFYPAATNDIQSVLCTGESLIVNGTTYNEVNPSGTEILTGASYQSCDSTININLTFNLTSVHNINSTLCPEESIIVNGTTYNEANPSGTEIIDNGAFNGCDSTISIDLSFFPVSINDFESDLCVGASITINGVIYNESNPSGTEIIANGSSNGCDSTIIIDLSFTQAASGSVSNSLCEGESIEVNGTIYNEANPTGIETIIGGSFFGCDSVITVNLNFLAAAQGNSNPILCAGDSIIINNTVYNQANPTGTEILENASSAGCDSIVNIALSFHETPFSNFNPSLCPGENIIVNGTVYDEANPTGTEVLENASYLGCDSLVNISLSFYPDAIHELNTMHCNGASIWVNGVEYNQSNPSGTETLIGASYHNCDSIVIIDLDFQDVIMGDFFPSLCPGENIIVNGTIYDESNPTGMELMENGSYLGCDSLTNVSVSFYAPAQSLVNDVLCASENIVINGQVYDQDNPSGIEVLENASSTGCDSTLQINLSFFEESIEIIEKTICQGSSFSINGVAYSSSGSFSETIENGNFNACDSTILLNLTVITIENLESANAGEDLMSCEEEAILQANQPANTTGLWSNLSSANLSSPTQATSSVDNLAFGANHFVWTLSTDICPDYSSDTIMINLENQVIASNDQIEMNYGDLNLEIPILNNDILNGIEDWEINLLSTPAYGTVQIIADELLYTAPEGFSGTVAFEYALCNANCPELCDDAEVRIFIPTPPPVIDTLLEIPNGITPNNDGINDVFIIPQLEYFPDKYPRNELIIFNRWGTIVYQAQPYQNDWDGKNKNGKKLPQGTYYYMLRLNLSQGEIFKGDVSILKN